LRRNIITIRQERLADRAGVRALNETAFGQPAEAAIVDFIRAAYPEAVSLVAADESRIGGHSQ
jgi:putative acetyltransferase